MRAFHAKRSGCSPAFVSASVFPAFAQVQAFGKDETAALDTDEAPEFANVARLSVNVVARLQRNQRRQMLNLIVVVENQVFGVRLLAVSAIEAERNTQRVGIAGRARVTMQSPISGWIAKDLPSTNCGVCICRFRTLRLLVA